MTVVAEMTLVKNNKDLQPLHVFGGIFNTLNGIKNFLNRKKNNREWIMQKYIERPLLYKERKFDIRIWVLVTSKLEIYMFKRGYVRTSSNKSSNK